MLRSITSLCLLLLTLVLLTGCWVADFATRPVDLTGAEDQVAKLEAAQAALKAFAVSLQDQLTQARAAFEATKSEAAAKVVDQTAKALATVQDKLPLVDNALAEAKAAVVKLKEQGANGSPLWIIAALVACRYAPRLVAMVPALAPFAGPIAAALSSLEWWLGATAAQKQQDAAAEAAAKALPHQVAVTHEALAVLDPAVAATIKKTAAADQELAGVLDTIRPLVLQIEAAERAKAA